MVVWMDRALFEYEPLIVLIITYCFLVFNFELKFLKRYCTEVAPLFAVGANLLECARGCLQPSGELVTRVTRVLATFWQIFNRVSELFATLWQITRRGLATFANSTYLPEGCQQRVLDNLCRHLQESCPINKEKGNLFPIPQKEPKVRTKVQEAIDNCKNYRFLSLVVHLNLVRQSL
jgi:hypothetical protein